MFSEYLKEHALHPLLCSTEDYHPYPRRQERDLWEALGADQKKDILAWGVEAEKGYPMLTATQFLAFVRNGSRLAYENPYFSRRHLLMGATLAECVADDGRYLDSVIDGLWCICEESTWVLSAHNGSDHPGQRPAKERPLPDVTNPYVDLFAAQTGAMLTDILYLLEDKLDAISPLLARRVRLEIDRRILTPFMNHDDFWWMGMIRQNMNNWTPWIVSNVIHTLLYIERDAHRRSDGISRGLRMLDSYLAVIPPDGGCDEGAGYFNMAGAALLDALESVYKATDGHVSFFHEPHIQAIASFPLHAHISGTYFMNFADCDAQPRMDGERIYQFGVYTGNQELAALGSSIYHCHSGVRALDTPQMNRVLFTLFAQIPQLSSPAPADFTLLPDLEVCSWRHNGLYWAIKGGHNEESHNHNDLGNFILYADGQPQVIDVGNCVYTAKTFSDERYTLMNTRAKNHNIPIIGDFEQQEGRQHQAIVLQFDENGAYLDLASAYPEPAGVSAFQRSLKLENETLVLQDCMHLKSALPVTWVFMLRHIPQIQSGRIVFGAMQLSFDCALKAEYTEIPVTDTRMAKNFPGSIWRLTLSADAKEHHTQRFLFERNP